MNLCLPLSLKNGNLGVPTSWTCSQNFCGHLFQVIQESSWEGGWMWVAWCHRIPEVFREKAAEWKWQGRSCWNYSCQQLVAALIENVRLNRFINFSSLQICHWNEQKGLKAVNWELHREQERGISGWGVSMPYRMRATYLKWKDLETTSEL